MDETRGRKLHTLQAAVYLHLKNVPAQVISECLAIDIDQVNSITSAKLSGVASCSNSGNEIPLETRKLICELSNEGWSLYEITKMMGIQEQAVISVLARSIEVSNDQISKMIGLGNEGKSLETISSELDVGVDSLLKILPGTDSESQSFIIEVEESREAENFDVIYKEGWVYKQSRYLKEWRRRWVVLTPYILCSYKIPQSYTSPTEQIFLKDCSSVKSAEAETRHSNGFRVDSGRVYYFYTEEPEEKEAWIEAIGRAMCSPTVVKVRTEEEPTCWRFFRSKSNQ